MERCEIDGFFKLQKKIINFMNTARCKSLIQFWICFSILLALLASGPFASIRKTFSASNMLSLIHKLWRLWSWITATFGLMICLFTFNWHQMRNIWPTEVEIFYHLFFISKYISKVWLRMLLGWAGSGYRYAYGLSARINTMFKKY